MRTLPLAAFFLVACTEAPALVEPAPSAPAAQPAQPAVDVEMPTPAAPPAVITAKPGGEAKAMAEAGQQCIYWGGEESSDPKRQKFLAESAERDCKAAVVFAKTYFGKFKSDAHAAFSVLRLVEHLGTDAEGIYTDKDKPALCKAASKHVEKLKKEGEDMFPYYKMACPKK